MTALGIDYAWSHPDPKAIKSAGYSFVMRYLSHDPSKDLTAAEVAALHNAGLSIGIVWETTATRAAEGAAAGAADRAEAERRAAALGYPTSCPIFYAVDFDATPAQVAPYFQGVTSGHTYPAGDYGGLRIAGAGLTPWHWQTEAWSGTTVSAAANLYQRVSPTHAIPGTAPGSWDENVLLKPGLPLWTPQPTPQPAEVHLPPDARGITTLHPTETLGLLGEKYFHDGNAGGTRILLFYGNKRRLFAAGVRGVWDHPRTPVLLLIPKALH